MVFSYFKETVMKYSPCFVQNFVQNSFIRNRTFFYNKLFTLFKCLTLFKQKLHAKTNLISDVYEYNLSLCFKKSIHSNLTIQKIFWVHFYNVLSFWKQYEDKRNKLVEKLNQQACHSIIHSIIGTKNGQKFSENTFDQLLSKVESKCIIFDMNKTPCVIKVKELLIEEQSIFKSNEIDKNVYDLLFDKIKNIIHTSITNPRRKTNFLIVEIGKINISHFLNNLTSRLYPQSCKLTVKESFAILFSDLTYGSFNLLKNKKKLRHIIGFTISQGFNIKIFHKDLNETEYKKNEEINY